MFVYDSGYSDISLNISSVGLEIHLLTSYLCQTRQTRFADYFDHLCTNDSCISFSRPHPRIQQRPGSMETSSSAHFDGAMSGTSTTSGDSRRGSTNTASSFLLAKMRSRNAHTYSRMELRSGTVQDIHSSEQSLLLSELRDFIATQCKTDGQATTVELLKHFSHKLPSSDTVLFKSLLHEICDFHRHLGEGLWSLKPEFR